MELELRNLINERFDRVDNRLDAIAGKLDETTEKTIINTQSLISVKEDLATAKSTQGRCSSYCENHRKDLRQFVVDKATSISRDGDQRQKIWILVSVVTAMAAIILPMIRDAIK